MKLDKICRTCLVQKNDLKLLFEACIPSMIMSISSVQIVQGDGLPHQICTQCLRDVNKAFCFKQKCEKSDLTLRNYFQTICQQDMFPQNDLLDNCGISCPVMSGNIQTSMDLIPESTAISTSMSILSDTIVASMTSLDTLNDIGKSLVINNVDGRSDLFGNGFQENPLFGEIFDNPDGQCLVESFPNNQENDLAETMQNLQTIAEQYLPESWENDVNPVNGDNSTNSNNFNLIETLVKCQFCGDLFKDAWLLEEHTKSQVCQDRYFSTNITNELTKSMLLEYTFDTNSSYNFVSDNMVTASENLLCNICDRTFTDQKYLKKHLKDIHFIDNAIQEEKKNICTLCGRRYKSYKALDVHLRTHTGERPLKCDVCARAFALPSSLHKHRRVHKERQYECNVCARKFKQQSHVNVHMLTVHSNEKRHVCLTCGKRFSTGTNLETHTRIHTGILPFACTFCEKRFSTSTQMKKHRMIHTGEKPYPCWICGQSFRRKETRDTHVRYHTRERQFACKMCDKKYISRSHLRDHIKSTHSDKPARKLDYCMICGKGFQSAKSLKAHIRLHTGERPFRCNYCSKCYISAKALNWHIKRSHTQE